MINKFEVTVTPEVLKNTIITDEYLFRDLARKMINEMPLEELHKLIWMTKIDPHSEESKKVMRDKIDRYKIGQIRQLIFDRKILYSAEVNLP
jgi:hypothetical protein